ncbi:MAG TPA: NAD(P)-dependent oxidoreductase [Methylomirabilota bacterium]|jgi:nucleoside-diphosphate-sugar epimerase
MTGPIGLVHGRPSPEPPGRVLLLGGGGFIGRRLHTVLERAGIPVVAPPRTQLDLAATGAGDRLCELVRAGDAVVFLAALTPDKGRGVAPFMANVAMGAAVCMALEKVAAGHVVYFSSDAVYGAADGRLTEGTSAAPSDLYGTMHLAREAMVRASTKAPVAVLRPTLVFGATDTHNSYGPNRLRRMAQKDGRIVLFGEGEEIRDHVDVDDVVALTLAVLRHRSAGMLNLASGRAVSYAELARKVADLFDRPITIAGTPRQTPIGHRHFDVTALHAAFPWFKFTTLEDGLARAHREMLEQG